MVNEFHAMSAWILWFHLIVCLPFLGKRFGVSLRWRNIIEACSMPPRIWISRFVPAALTSVCCNKPWAVLASNFSRLRRRVYSLVRLTARCPCGCWACSVLSFKASYRRLFLIVSMESSFRDSRILPWVPKDGGRPVSDMRTTSSSGSFRLPSLSFLLMASVDLT